MKEKLTRNISIKILSVLLAAILWLAITNLDDPVQYKSFTNVPVTIKNEGIITTEEKSYVITEGETVDFKVAARRSIIENISVSDFEVTADFAYLSQVNSVGINISPRRYKNEIQIVDRGDIQNVTISIEELSEADFKINVVEKGKVSEGYYLGPEFATPNMIRVSGPKSKIEQIKQVIVEVDVEGASSTVRRLSEPIALDEEGNAIELNRLAFSTYYFEAGFELYQIKEIPLKIGTTGKPADGYIMTGIEYQPKTIEIAAKSTVLRNIDKLEVSLDITGASANIEEFIDLQKWLEEGVYMVAEDTTASVNVTIEKLETKELSIWPNDIELKNKSISLEAVYLTKGPIKVNIQGPASEIEPITRNNLKPYVNLLGYSTGTYYFDIETNISANIDFNDNPSVLINLMSQQ